jgi:Tfp pilus assembly protein PilO
MIKTNTKKILTVVIIIFVLVFLFDALYFSFLDNKALEVFNLHKIFYGEYSQNHTAANLEEKLADLDSKELLISGLFLPEEKIVNFIDELETIGTNNNVVVEIKNVDASGLVDKETNKKKTYADLSITMNAVGDWNSIYKFANLMENLPYYSNVESINLTSGTEERSDYWNAEINIKVITKTK